MIKFVLNNAFNNGEYQKYITIFEEYLNKNYGLDANMLIQYVTVLIHLKKYEEAANILINLIPDAKKYHFEYKVASQLFFCSKLEVAEDLMSSIENPNYLDCYLLGKIYLREGKIENAKQEFTKVIKKGKSIGKCYDMTVQSLKEIENHEKYGAFIKINYYSFLKQGNKLEPGHIVYLKQRIDKVNGNMQNEDVKAADRPYLIYKIENDILYLFAVTTNGNHQLTKLSKTDYPNFECDRYVKDNLLTTNVSNVASINVKISNKDFQRITKYLFKGIYFSGNSKENKGKEFFLKSYIGEISISNIIEFVEPRTKQISFYFVIDKTESEYKVVEINLESLEVLNQFPENIKTSRVVYNVIRLSKPEIEYVLEQIPDSIKCKSVVQAVINYNGQDKIIISETSDKHICIDALYSTSFISLQTIDKTELFNIKRFISDEEFAYIKKIVDENYLNSLKEKSKLGSRRRKRISFD